MNVLASLAAMPFPQAVGLALIHFLWQGALIGALLSGALLLLRNRSATARYLTCLGALALLLLAPAVTAYVLLGQLDLGRGGALGASLPAAGVHAPNWITQLLPWITGGWIVGAMALQARLLIQGIRVERMRHDGLSAVPGAWREELDRLRRLLGVSRAVRLVASKRVPVPAVIGWLRPMILIPAASLAGMRADQLQAVLAHELAHIRRHDYLVNLLQSVAEALLFFHPVTWWISARLRTEREFCCDDLAVGVCPSRRTYAEALSSLDELCEALPGAALASSQGPLFARVVRVVGNGRLPVEGSARWLAPGAVLATLTALLLASGLTQVAGSLEVERTPAPGGSRVRIDEFLLPVGEPPGGPGRVVVLETFADARAIARGGRMLRQLEPPGLQAEAVVMLRSSKRLGEGELEALPELGGLLEVLMGEVEEGQEDLDASAREKLATILAAGGRVCIRRIDASGNGWVYVLEDEDN